MPAPPRAGTVALRTGAAAAGAGLAAGLGLLAYARWEAQAFVLDEVAVPGMPSAADGLRILHLSDIHLAPGQTRKRAFVRELASLAPDLVVSTGDLLAHASAVRPLLEDLGPLLDRPGAFVLGSNDLVAPVRKNPARYLLPDARTPLMLQQDLAPSLPTRLLVDSLTAAGWRDLDNRRDQVSAGGTLLDLVGVDDPHLERDRMPGPAPRPEGAAARIGVAHAPYLAVLDAFVDDGCDVLLAGHTHGGQICVPGHGALVSNCDLPPSQARGLSARSGVPLHVSQGIGTSPYQQWRIACRPGASLLTLHA
jgi:uncharacterized protein